MIIHVEEHPLAGQTVRLKSGQEYRVEDWADRVMGGSVWQAAGNPACLKFAIRSAMEGLPLNDDLLYGKIGMFGEIVHVLELAEE